MKYERKALAMDIGLWTVEMQRDRYRDQPDYSHFPEADRKKRASDVENILKVQDLIINHIKDGGL